MTEDNPIVREAKRAEPSAEQATPYRWAGGSVDITPDAPTPLAGCVGRPQPWKAVSSRLEANAVLLDDGDARVLFISADLLYFGADLVSAVAKQAGKAGIAREHIILTASHTHFAPAADRSKPFLGEVDADYNRHLEMRLFGLVDAVLSANTEAVRIDSSRVRIDLNVNRRRRWPLPVLTRDGLKVLPSVVMAPAPREPKDEFIDLLRIVNSRGKVVSVLWKYGCHPVCFPEALNVSSEYPGHARGLLRQKLNDDVPVVFWQGFTGDVRPSLNGGRSWNDRLQTLRRGPGFGTPSMAEWRHWADQIADALIAGVTNLTPKTVAGPLRVATTEVPISALVETASTQPSDRAMTIQRIEFGERFAVTFIAAEVCSPYLEMLGANDSNICVGYAGDTFGYLPSERQARQGGYEGGGFLGPFSLRGRFRSGFEREVVQAVQRLQAPVEPDADAASSSIGVEPHPTS
jgi:hypothetical protein